MLSGENFDASLMTAWGKMPDVCWYNMPQRIFSMTIRLVENMTTSVQYVAPIITIKADLDVTV